MPLMGFRKAAKTLGRKVKPMIDDEERKKKMLQAARGATVGGVAGGATKVADKMMSQIKMGKGLSAGQSKQMSEIGKIADEMRKKKKKLVTGFRRV